MKPQVVLFKNKREPSGLPFLLNETACKITRAFGFDLNGISLDGASVFRGLAAARAADLGLRDLYCFGTGFEPVEISMFSNPATAAAR